MLEGEGANREVSLLGERSRGGPIEREAAFAVDRTTHRACKEHELEADPIARNVLPVRIAGDRWPDVGAAVSDDEKPVSAAVDHFLAIARAPSGGEPQVEPRRRVEDVARRWARCRRGWVRG